MNTCDEWSHSRISAWILALRDVRKWLVRREKNMSSLKHPPTHTHTLSPPPHTQYSRRASNEFLRIRRKAEQCEIVELEQELLVTSQARQQYRCR